MRVQEQLTVIVPWGWDHLFICFYSFNSPSEYHFPLDIMWFRIIIVVKMFYILTEIRWLLYLQLGMPLLPDQLILSQRWGTRAACGRLRPTSATSLEAFRASSIPMLL